MKKILLIDDEPDVREIMSMLIESEFNLEIVEAEDGDQAIDILKKVVSGFSPEESVIDIVHQQNLSKN